MPLTARELNRATLDRQLLLERQAIPVTEAVRRAVAIQAQEPASPYLALWNRVEGFDPSDLDRAFADHSVVKASLMRITLHAVHADDYTTFHQSMVPALRASRLNDNRFRNTGLTVDDADGLIPDLLGFTSTPRTKVEIEEMFGERLGARPHERLWWALRTYAPLVHAPDVTAAWGFSRTQKFRAAPTVPPRVTREEALAQLIHRYLEGFGPATRHDIGRFTLIAQSTIKPILDKMVHLEVLEGPGGEEMFDIPGGSIPAGERPAPPRLMAMWDSVLLAHADRSRILAEEHRKAVIRSNGDVLPTILVDGKVAGVWRHLDGAIEIRAFHSLSDEEWEGLESESTRLLGLLGQRDPAVYRRYARWWGTSEIAGAEPRVFAI